MYLYLSQCYTDRYHINTGEITVLIIKHIINNTGITDIYLPLPPGDNPDLLYLPGLSPVVTIPTFVRGSPVHH